MTEASAAAQLSNLTGDVQVVLERLVAGAVDALGANLRSIVLYGSAAEGRMRSTSDVNVLFVLERAEQQSLDRLRDLIAAASVIRLAPMFVTTDELPFATEAFAQKFRDIEARHVLLHGSNPFASIDVSREALIRRLKQVLLNLTLRLRESYVARSMFEEQATRIIADSAAPLRTSAAAILELESGEKLQPKEALEALVRKMPGSHGEVLQHISTARETRRLEAGRAAPALFELTEIAEEMFRRVVALERG